MTIYPQIENIIYDVSTITDYDVFLFKEGNHFRLYEKYGSHLMTVNNIHGASFAVRPLNAKRVSVIGDFNRWNTETHPLKARADDSGNWEGFIPGVNHGTLYKYHIY